MKNQNHSILILGLLFVLLLSSLASAFSIDNTRIESEGLNTNITVNQTVYADVLDVQDDYIYFENLLVYSGGEYLNYTINITDSDMDYVYNSTQKDLPHILSSSNTEKVINSTLFNTTEIATIVVSSTLCSTVNTIESVTASNGTVLSYSCTAPYITVNMIIPSGVTTLTINKANGEIIMANWVNTFVGMFALLIIVVFLFIALGFMLPMMGGTAPEMDIAKIVWIFVLTAILFAAGIVIFSSLGI